MKTLQWNAQDADHYSAYDSSERVVIHPEMTKLFGEVRGKHIADYGCGEGDLLRELSEQGAHTYGYDISAAMIDKARERSRGSTLETITSGQIPLPEAHLDAVFSNLVLMMCPSLNEIRGIFREIHRVLKKDGALIYCITHPAFVDRAFTTYRNIFDGGMSYLQEGQKHQFVLRKQDGEEITDSSFIDYHYPISAYLNLLPETSFSFEGMKEIMLPGNSLPGYLIVKGVKK